MNRRLYWTLAWSGIRKNRQLYLPYMLTCVCVVMVYYILASLVWSEMLAGTYGGRTMTAILALGRAVVAVFAVIFLFYTHSFLIRRRSREFGLYNILGMNKGDIRRILLRESLLVYVLTLAGGLALGIVLSKLSELLLLRITGNDVAYTLSVSGRSIGEAAGLFAAIFALILLVSVARVQLSSPIALLRSENTGEKPPKGNLLIALLGLLILGFAYWLAVTIEDPVSAMTAFFFAVVMVILATYLLFISGSVTLCRLLQKNKSYYYRASHFVSVSSMRYRMKRNGAGLASICILSTMVLIMLATTITLFAGTEDNLRTAYPTDLRGTIYFFDRAEFKEEYLEACRAALPEATLGHGRNETALRSVQIYGVMADDGTFSQHGDFSEISDLLQMIPLSDYNAVTGQNVTLSEDQALLWITDDGTALPEEKLPGIFACEGAHALQIVGTFELSALHMPIQETAGKTVILVTPDPVAYADETDPEAFYYYFWFMADLDEEGKLLFTGDMSRFDFVGRLREEIPESVDLGYSSASRAEMREEIYALYGSLFFLGVMLSIVFILAAVLIIYYKQVSEGYEDAARFDVMRKVGMTRREIRRSIDSQVLVVFFAPLVMAGLHIAFAFPMIRRMLRLLSVTRLGVLIPVYAGAFVLFALFYAVVYRLTARTYLSIVSPKEAA